jgi:hypothetical protein
MESWRTGRGYSGKVLAEVLEKSQKNREVGKVSREHGLYERGVSR